MFRKISRCALLLCLAVPGIRAEEAAVVWKDYENAFLGVKLRVKKDWTETTVKETKDTGSIAFAMRITDPHSRVYVMRQKEQYPFAIWMSPEVLTQIYEPGYKRSTLEFAGHKCVRIIGINKNDTQKRREETYYFDRSPYLDQITFSAPEDQWFLVEPDFAFLRKNIRWIPKP
jgi:hypothetical protein